MLFFSGDKTDLPSCKKKTLTKQKEVQNLMKIEKIYLKVFNISLKTVAGDEYLMLMGPYFIASRNIAYYTKAYVK